MFIGIFNTINFTSINQLIASHNVGSSQLAYLNYSLGLLHPSIAEINSIKAALMSDSIEAFQYFTIYFS